MWEHLFTPFARYLQGCPNRHNPFETGRKSPTYEGDIRFVDIESGAGVEVTMTEPFNSQLYKNERSP